jgi:hypothetical protein
MCRPDEEALLCLIPQEFAPIAKDFQKNKWVNFTPHYLVWLCPGSFSNLAECKSQCIRRGRYCTPDPDGDLTKGYSGRDIVQVHSTCNTVTEGLLGSVLCGTIPFCRAASPCSASYHSSLEQASKAETKDDNCTVVFNLKSACWKGPPTFYKRVGGKVRPQYIVAEHAKSDKF